MTNKVKNEIPQGNASMTLPSLEFKSRGFVHVHKLIGSSLSCLHNLLFHLTDQGMNILIVGERGTGKELAASLFAELSKKELAPINCAVASGNSLISQLFGHVKDAYTGANSERKGLIKKHHENGIIFLDEIGDASDHFQALLLRYLETGDFSPFGSDKIEKKYKATIISATSKPEKLREDLRDRFTTVTIPPLRDHKEDIPHLIKYFWDNESEKGIDKRRQYISYDALNAFENYHWPGNVRELKKCFRLAEMLCKIRNGKVLRTSDFPLFTNRSPIEDISRKRIIANLKSVSRVISITEYLKVPEHRNCDVKKSDTDQVQQMPIEKTLEKVSPDEYKTMFWKYHTKKGRGGAELAKMFGINKSTATKQIQKAKEKLA